MTDQTMPPYTLVQDIATHQDIPEDGILTRTILDNDHTKVVLFTFSKDQELSEHTSTKPAILHFLQGTAELALGEDTMPVTAGAWVHMPAKTPHRIRTQTPVVMLLVLIKQDG